MNGVKSVSTTPKNVVIHTTKKEYDMNRTSLRTESLKTSGASSLPRTMRYRDWVVQPTESHAMAFMREELVALAEHA